MTIEEKLKFCRACENRKMTAEVGIVCALTSEKPAFEDKCADFKIDQVEADRIIRLEQEVEYEEESGGYFEMEQKGIRKGVAGGILMMVIAVVWFFGALAAGYVFFYPPILFAIGLYALIKGVVKGNISGKAS